MLVRLLRTLLVRKGTIINYSKLRVYDVYYYRIYGVRGGYALEIFRILY